MICSGRSRADDGAPAVSVALPAHAGCHIGGPEQFSEGVRQLFALRAEPDFLPDYDYELVDTLYYPGGQPSFHLVEIEGRH